MQALTGERDLAFFDAIAPVVHRETIDHVGRLVRSRATTRRGRPAPAPTTSTAR